jgi:hypothetical protein
MKLNSRGLRGLTSKLIAASAVTIASLGLPFPCNNSNTANAQSSNQQMLDVIKRANGTNPTAGLNRSSTNSQGNSRSFNSPITRFPSRTPHRNMPHSHKNASKIAGIAVGAIGLLSTLETLDKWANPSQGYQRPEKTFVRVAENRKELSTLDEVRCLSGKAFEVGFKCPDYLAKPVKYAIVTLGEDNRVIDTKKGIIPTTHLFREFFTTLSLGAKSEGDCSVFLYYGDNDQDGNPDYVTTKKVRFRTLNSKMDARSNKEQMTPTQTRSTPQSNSKGTYEVFIKSNGKDLFRAKNQSIAFKNQKNLEVGLRLPFIRESDQPYSMLLQNTDTNQSYPVSGVFPRNRIEHSMNLDISSLPAGNYKITPLTDIDQDNEVDILDSHNLRIIKQ